ncbi:MAG: MFS transporter [Clostridia bacterium]|nr:MFS transporter [Clostridia bacterium]
MKKKATEAAPVLDEQGRKPLKLDYPQTIKVGFAFAIIMLFWTAYDFVVPLLLEHAYGLPNSLRGLIMGLDNLLSLFMLPFFGKLSDNANGKLAKKFGKRTPFIVIGTLASVLLMVFVPVATLNQQKNANTYVDNLRASMTDIVVTEDGHEITKLESLLTEWYDNGNQNYCDQSYLKMNNVTREQFIKLSYDENFSSKKAVLNMIGAETYYYVIDGETVEVQLTDIAPSGETYEVIRDRNADYNKYVASGMNNYESDQIYENVTKKTGGASIGVYMVILLLVLVAMATFRSPAVALMPDVTPKPLRSQGNAMINLCGGVGGAIAFLIYTVVLFGNSLYNYVIIFASIAAGMLLLLAGFLALVKERKMVDKCQEICKEYGIDDFADEENATSEEGKGTDVVMTDTAGNFVADTAETPDNAEALSPETLEFAKEVAKNAKTPRKSPKEWWNSKPKEEQSKLISFWLILASIFMWFMGYNAISSNLSVYTTKALNLSAGVASIISGVSMGISAIAFIPVGYMAAKIGRRKSIIIGFGLAVVSFVLIFFFVKPNNNAIIPAVLFALFYLIAGFGLIIANVNTFPMVTELSTSQTLGQYTGYYYMATMSAQAITPFIAGLIMDHISNTALFMYSAICVIIAIVLMVFVKHGDSVIIGKGKKLTKEEKKQIRLDALDAD